MAAVPVFRPEPVVRTPEVRRPVATPAPQAKPKAKARRKAKRKINVGARVAVFSTLALVSFMVNSMAGNVMVEKARREGIQAAQRTREARNVQAALTRQVMALSSADASADWARSRGFVAPDQAGISSGTPTRVALNR